MTVGMTFRGEISLSGELELEGNALVNAAAFTRVGSTNRFRIDRELSAPASMWDPTIAMLSTLRARAQGGRIMCVYDSDGPEDQIEVVAGSDYDPPSDKGPFPVAFIGALTFAAAPKRVDVELPLEIKGNVVSIRARRAMSRKAWCATTSTLAHLAEGAIEGHIDTKILHTYLPDGEVMRIDAGKSCPVLVWD